MDAPDIVIESRAKPLCDVPPLSMGNMPLDGGALIVEDGERDEFLRREPGAAPFLRRLMGSKEFINNLPRWCLWLKDAPPAAVRALPLVMERVKRVHDFRAASHRATTVKLANAPTLFGEIRQPTTHYLIAPKVSSERREYMPVGFMDEQTIATDLVFIVPDATVYHFGVLTSSVHNAWMRAVAGRLESRYRYSKNVVYNNFPWPSAACSASLREKIASVACPVSLREKIESTGQSILDVRAKYGTSSLADLYDPLTMPLDLRAAHAANDRAVLAAYGIPPDTSEPEIVAHLFRLYAQLTAAGK